MTKADRYAAAGVKLDVADEAKRRIAELARAIKQVLANGLTLLGIRAPERM